MVAIVRREARVEETDLQVVLIVVEEIIVAAELVIFLRTLSLRRIFPLALLLF